MARSFFSFALSSLLPVILAVTNCVACFSVVSPSPASICCKHRSHCPEKTGHPDCLAQPADPGQAEQTVAPALTALAIPAPTAEPVTPDHPRVARALTPPGREASPPGLFVLHSSLLI